MHAISTCRTSRSHDREAGDIRHSGPLRACRAISNTLTKTKRNKRVTKGGNRQQTKNKWNFFVFCLFFIFAFGRRRSFYFWSGLPPWMVTKFGRRPRQQKIVRCSSVPQFKHQQLCSLHVLAVCDCCCGARCWCCCCCSASFDAASGCGDGERDHPDDSVGWECDGVAWYSR